MAAIESTCAQLGQIGMRCLSSRGRAPLVGTQPHPLSGPCRVSPACHPALHMGTAASKSSNETPRIAEHSVIRRVGLYWCDGPTPADRETGRADSRWSRDVYPPLRAGRYDPLSDRQRGGYAAECCAPLRRHQGRGHQGGSRTSHNPGNRPHYRVACRTPPHGADHHPARRAVQRGPCSARDQPACRRARCRQLSHAFHPRSPGRHVPDFPGPSRGGLGRRVPRRRQDGPGSSRPPGTGPRSTRRRPSAWLGFDSDHYKKTRQGAADVLSRLE